MNNSDFKQLIISIINVSVIIIFCIMAFNFTNSNSVKSQPIGQSENILVQNNKKQFPKEIIDCNKLDLFIMSYWDTINANFEDGEEKINYYFAHCEQKGYADKFFMLSINAQSASEHTNNINKKIEYLKTAYNYAIKSTSPNKYYDNIALILGKTYFQEGDYNQSLIWFQKIIPSYNKNNNRPYLLPAFLADNYMQLADYSKAEKLYKEAAANLENNWNERSIDVYNEIQTKIIVAQTMISNDR